MKAAAVYLGLVALAAAVFLLAPQLDLATSRLFYTPGRGFALADWPPVVLLYRAIPWLAWGLLLLLAVAAVWLFLTGRALWRLDRKALVFVAAALALGPGLLANTVFKDHWGRARPAQVEAFGGPREFTPAPLPARECERNCAFVSGHAALGFSLVAFAFLLPPGPARRSSIAAALGFGALVGLARIVQGSHFPSDVVFAGFLVYGVTAALYRALVEKDVLASPVMTRFYRWIERAAAAGLDAVRRFREEPLGRPALWFAAIAVAVVVSIAAIDRPLAFFLHDKGPDLRALFDLTGRLGLTWGYLTVFGLVFVALHWGGAFPRLRPLAPRMRALSAVPAFLFASLAASGLAVDLLKVILGRTRPKLLFSADTYDFTWLGARADHWSFPSGHAATIAALMTALWCLWPRHLLFYILVGAIVAASRVVVGAHYLSDALAGAFIAVATTRGVALLFARGGIDLGASARTRNAATPPWPCRIACRIATRRGRAGSR
jgi:lipid A 4'-phosphatase